MREGGKPMTSYSLDGPVQFTLLAVVLAVVAYIRNIPYKELKDRLTTPPADGTPLSAKKCCMIKAQLLVLDLMQIVLAAIGVLLVGRFQLGDRYDAYILFTLWLLAFVLFFMHVLVNGYNIYKTLFK
jgi:Ca2+/Na+ antiporter